MITMTSLPYSDSDREIEDTIRMYLVVCYTNAEDRREYTREELEESFASDTALRAWVTDRAGINPDTLAAETPVGRAFINVVCTPMYALIAGLPESEDCLRRVLST